MSDAHEGKLVAARPRGKLPAGKSPQPPFAKGGQGGFPVPPFLLRFAPSLRNLAGFDTHSRKRRMAKKKKKQSSADLHRQVKDSLQALPYVVDQQKKQG